jgi:branched-chain amino acid transport system substrate-binding protein
MKRKLLSILFAAAMVFGITVCAMAEEGVTDTEIHIGQWGPQTGPAAAWGSVARGTDAYFKMINDEGGINGRKLVLHMFDDGYNPAKTKAGVKELQEGKGMFAWVSGVGSATGLAVKDYLMEKKIPWVGPAAGNQVWVTPPSKYLFGVYPQYFIEARALCNYGATKMGKKKFAIVYQNDAYGKEGLAGTEAELGKLGLKLVESVPVEVTDTDLKPHVMKLKQSEAEVVILFVNPSHGLRIIGTSAAMQFAPQWMSTSTLSDFPFMNTIGKGLWTGVITASFGEVPDSPSPLMQKYKKAHEKYAAKEERWGVFFYAGFGFVEPAVEALRRCGKDVTRERFVKELEGLKNFKGILGTVNFKPFNEKDPSCRQGTNEVFLVQCTENSGYKQLTGWTKYE